jgi:hypothetical protein
MCAGKLAGRGYSASFFAKTHEPGFASESWFGQNERYLQKRATEHTTAQSALGAGEVTPSFSLLLLFRNPTENLPRRKFANFFD